MLFTLATLAIVGVFMWTGVYSEQLKSARIMLSVAVKRKRPPGIGLLPPREHRCLDDALERGVVAIDHPVVRDRSLTQYAGWVMPALRYLKVRPQFPGPAVFSAS
jgi:hypothetical protein